jgi:anti-anti-sigma factor
MELFRTYQNKSFLVVEFSGESLLPQATLRDLPGQLYPLIDEQHHTKIILNLSKVRDISSQFIGIIVAMHTKCSKTKGKLVLVGLNDKLHELMALTRLDRIIAIKPSIGDAVERDAFL